MKNIDDEIHGRITDLKENSKAQSETFLLNSCKKNIFQSDYRRQ